MIKFENKIFEEIDIPENSKIVSEDKEKELVIMESSWTGSIEGINAFPSGTAKGHGKSLIFENGISISNWRGIFKTDNGIELTFLGKDTSKSGKFYVLRTFFTKDKELGWINGLVCILDGVFDAQNNSFICSGYKLM